MEKIKLFVGGLGLIVLMGCSIFATDDKSTMAADPGNVSTAGEFSIGGYNLSSGKKISFVRGFRQNKRIYLRQKSGRATLSGQVTNGTGNLSCGGSSCNLSGVPSGGPGIRVTVRITVNNNSSNHASGGVWHN